MDDGRMMERGRGGRMLEGCSSGTRPGGRSWAGRGCSRRCGQRWGQGSVGGVGGVEGCVVVDGGRWSVGDDRCSETPRRGGAMLLQR